MKEEKVNRLSKKYFQSFGIGEDWLRILQPVLSSPEMYKVMSKVEWLSKIKIIFPRKENWFKAFQVTPLDKLKVLILGQDPYHDIKNGTCTANGLAFSYTKTSAIDAYEPPSLKNILKEVEDDIHDGMCFGECLDTDLTRWAKQGVLLLNTALTVERGKPGSHTNLWSGVIPAMLHHIAEVNPGLIVMLWGNHAKSYKHIFHPEIHHILESGHPSPLSANKGLWFGNKHFSQANEIIESQNGTEFKIKW